MHPRSDDLGQESPGQGLDAVTADLPHLDLLTVVDDFGQRVPVVELQVLGLVQRGAQADGDVAGDVVAAHWQHRQVPRGALVIDRHGCVARPDLDQADAEVHLLRSQHAFAGGKP